MNNIVYETPRLIVRQYSAEDVADLYAWASIPEMARYQFWDAFKTVDEARLEIEHMMTRPINAVGKWNEYPIIQRDTGHGIGAVAINIDASEHKQFELGWNVAPAYQGQGFGTEACRALLEMAFKLGAHRVMASIDPRNLASTRLAEVIGMRLEARLRERYWIKGEWCDDCIYAVLREDVARP